MRGLLIKDFKTIFVVQKTTLVFFLLFEVWFAYMGMAGAAMGYVIMLSVFISIGTISYDDFNNGTTFLFTLPFERREYVTGKYLFGILLGTFGAVVGFLGCIISEVIRHGAVEWREPLLTALGVLAVGILMLSLALPVQLKFGAEKGRVVMMMFYGTIGLIVSFGFISLQGNVINESELLAWVQGSNGAILAVLAAVLYLICLAVSYMLSVRIVEKKEL